MSNEKEKLPTSPDWSTAPDWAQYFAIDKDGEGYFYYLEPFFYHIGFWNNQCETSPKIAGIFDATNWENSLQKRPD